MKKRQIIGLLCILSALAFVSWGVYDHNLNPECYSINRTWSSIEQRYIEGDILKAVYVNSTEEELPDCYIYRSVIFNWAQKIGGLIILYLAIDLLYLRYDKKKRKSLIKTLRKSLTDREK